jgi:glyoxylase I family protein
MRWSHVGLNCRDTKLTREFYERWFGFTLARAVPAGGAEILFLRKDDVYLELFPAAPGAPAAPAAAAGAAGAPADGAGTEVPGAVRHIAFQTADVDAFVREMGEEADVTLGPLDFDEFIAGWKTVWLRDPDGVVVEVSQGYRDEEK